MYHPHEDKHTGSNNRIPNSTLRHFAFFFAPEASDPSIADAAKLFDSLRTSDGMLRRRPESDDDNNNNDDVGTCFLRAVSATDYLTSLPAELLTLLRSYLNPADLICLARTCRTLSRALDYTLDDLGVVAAAWEPAALVHDRGVRAALARQRYDATARLDRDRLAALEKAPDGDDDICKICVRRHPRTCFAGESDAGRGCLAAEAKIRVCEHWSEDLASLRTRRRRVRCGGRTRAWWEECEHPSHRRESRRLDVDGGDVGFGAPCMLEFGGVFVVERTMVLMRTKLRRRNIACEAVHEALRRRAHVRICPHTKLGDETVAKAFGKRSRVSKQDFADKDRDAVLELPEYEIMSCKECGCHWSFEVKSFEGKTTVRLNLDLQLPVLKDPWDKEYLKNVEGGGELLDLMSRGMEAR